MIADRVKELSTSTGTGAFTLTGAVTGFEGFNTAFGVGPSFDYCIESIDGTTGAPNGSWEIGSGHLSGATTLVRDTVRQSSNADALVAFAAGTKNVFCTLPASVVIALQAKLDDAPVDGKTYGRKDAAWAEAAGISALNAKEDKASKGIANGYASLDASTKVPAAQLPTLTKSDVGLANVDNTSDANKPISTATQAGLDAKVAKAGDTMTGALNISATTASSSPTTGALTVAGGLGVGGAVNVTGTLTAPFLQADGVAATKGNLYADADTGASCVIHFRDTGGSVTKAQAGWFRSDNTAKFLHLASSTELSLSATGIVKLGKGWFGKAGYTSGAYSANALNLYWNATNCHIFVDDSDLGAITTSCDYRIKKDVAPLTSTWDAIKRLRPISYTQAEYTPPGAKVPLFVTDETQRWGFLAHEMQDALLPSAAHGSKDSPTEIQTPNLLAIIAALTKTLQEAMTRIEALESGGT